ncbi:uncharacterized protein LOC132278330 [Cornus florida]|uniref:uncharacterized protein LOC132278330 n=1 Tax=Cornus florida TaxID=4283 RepID=UPI002898CB76|nr:uncharacterized protein LOC132278330 [Cornus florida]
MDRLPLRAANRNERQSRGQRIRARFAKCPIISRLSVFLALFHLFVAAALYMYLQGMERPSDVLADRGMVSGDGGFDFGKDINSELSKRLAKFPKENDNVSSASGKGVRYGYMKPRLALVFAHLLVDPLQILMVSVVVALREIGYKVVVYSLEDGPVHAVWRNIGVPVKIMETGGKMEIIVDWQNYDGILVNSLEASGIFPCLMQEPFKSVPLIWTIHESALATRLTQYISAGQVELVNNWKKFFRRATVVVFPNYALPMLYAACDSGNYFVIPGSPDEAWEADKYMLLYQNNLRREMDYGLDDFVIAIVGSQFLYTGLWLEHAFILQALLPLLADFSSVNNYSSHLKIVILTGDSTGNYSMAVEAIAMNLSYPAGIVKHVSVVDQDADGVLHMANLVIHGSFLNELSFPHILAKAMCFGKPIIAPELTSIRKYVVDKVNGYLFPRENIRALTDLVLQVVSKGRLSPLARKVALLGKYSSKNLMVQETVEGYASLLENVLKFPSEVATPKDVSEIPHKLKEEWQWHLFKKMAGSTYPNRSLRNYRFLDKVERQWNYTQTEGSGSGSVLDETFSYTIWEEEEYIETDDTRKRREEEELKDRTYQARGTLEEANRITKKADRKSDLHERDDGELERTGQPLCIYEPYFGEGTWPFLHQTSLYRGLGLSTKGRRPGADDIDARSRLPLLNSAYYRDVLGEYGAFFAIATGIDRIHKNAWIGFQSWRATAIKRSLSKTAENALLEAIQARKHGDTLYFWARMDVDPRNPLQQDFWSFCDAINAGNCRFAFSEALKQMYGIKHEQNYLPPMPVNGDTWAVMHSWALPTRSFLEFVMFSRMFVDALDSQIYDEHHESGHCYLSLSKDKHCYSRVLELLVNVWAFHSARRMVYVNPDTGVMQEHHKLKSRRGQMWLKWFSYSTLKSMDEDLAEESDSDNSRERWLWPLTGEVFWQGVYEREKIQRNQEKEKRKQRSKEKIARMKKKSRRQKPIGKYVKPPPEGVENSESPPEDVENSESPPEEVENSE